MDQPASGRILDRPTSTAAYDMALMVKHHVGPRVA